MCPTDTTPSLGSLTSSEQLIQDLYVGLRQKIGMWANITKQTAQARMGYIGQHLVSVVTGFPGGRSGARGKDLVLSDEEFAEIKTCYRVDQLGKCNNCESGVSALESKCPSCGSDDIKRNDDSKWLIGIQHEKEFSEILNPKYYYLVLFDFTDLQNQNTIRASIWQVDPMKPGFAYCLIDYYKNIKTASRSGAPFNLWPFELKFELMRPILIYQSFIMSDNTIRTRIFPGRDAVEKHFSPLKEFSRSRNLTVENIKFFADMLKIELPNSTKKTELLEAAQNEITHRDLNLDTVVDTLALAIYKEKIEQHIVCLPPEMRRKMMDANLLSGFS